MNKKRASVFIDVANLNRPLKKYDWKIDYKRFRQYFEDKYNVSDLFYYYGEHSFKSFTDGRHDLSKQDFEFYDANKKAFYNFLQRNGYTIRTKAVNSLFDAQRRKFIQKCNFDVELTIDAIDTINNYDTAFIVSGDGDLLELVKYLKGKHKQVWVLYFKRRAHHRLLKAAGKNKINLNTIQNKIAQVEKKKKAKIIKPSS